MSANPQTTFAGTAGNPFGMVPPTTASKPAAPLKAVAKPAAPVVYVPLSIHSDPLPGHREKKPGKYAELFAQMEPGKNVRCQPNQVGTVSKALLNWLKANEYPGTVRSQRMGDDGLGRVWWLAGTPLLIDGVETPFSTTPRTA